MSMTKKAVLGLFAGVLAAMPLASFAEEAAESEVTASLDVPVLSAYVWRGQVLNDEAVLQPTFTVGKGAFSINWWGNLNLTDNATGDDAEFSEHDITVSYSTVCPLTGAEMTLGVVNYDFPNVGLADADGNLSLVNDTREAFLIASFGDVLLAPTASIYYDFKEADGFYVSLGISHSLEVAEGTSLDLAASIGGANSDWGDFYYGEADGLTDFSVSASLPLAVCDTVTITPGVQYVSLLGDAEDAVDGSDGALYFGETDYVVGSVKASFAF
jgi:hypothetical protein